MKWKSHTIVVGSFLYALGLEPGAIMLGTASAVLPDRIETPFGSAGPRLLKHRGWSHELMLWLFLFLALLAWKPVLCTNWPIDLLRSVCSVFQSRGRPGALDFPLWAIPLGAMLHLLLGDLLTPAGITIWGKKVSCSLFKTGSWREYLWTGGFAAFCLFSHRFATLLKAYLPFCG